MKFDKTQKRALVFVAGLLGLSWYMGNQFEKADMMRSETDAYTYAYNEGHSDSRKEEDYQPVLTSGREEARFRKILKQRAETFNETFASPDDYCSACHVDGDNSTGRMYLVCDDCGGSYGVETFNAPYAGSGSLMNIGQDTSLGNFTSKELTESSAIHGDFNEASLNYSGHQNLQVRGVETFNAPATKKPKLTKTQLEDLNRMKASTFYGSGGYAYVEVDNRGWKPYTTRPVQALLDKGIITIPKNENRRFYGRVESMEAYIVYLNPVAWEYPFRYDYDKSLSQVGNKIVQNKKIQQQEHARILKQRQDEENMTEDEMWDNLFANSPELKEIYGFGAEIQGIKITEIDWETDGEDVELPSSVMVPSDLEEDEIADYLSDNYGWLVNGFIMGAETFDAEYDFQNVAITTITADNEEEAREKFAGSYDASHEIWDIVDVREAETMTPSEVRVKVTKDVTPKGSKIIVEECVDIQAHKADAYANFYRVRFRDPAEMSNFRVPAWAARAANTMGSKYYDVAGSKVTMGQDKSGNWKIQSVMVPKRANVDVDLALKIANHIQDRLEKEGRWASKNCQDNERVLIIR